MVNLTWEIPFWIFVGISASRFFLAPYWLDQEREEEIKNLKDIGQQDKDFLRQRITELEDQLEDQLDKRTR